MKALILMSLFVMDYAKHEEYIGWKSYYIGPSARRPMLNLHTQAANLDLDFLNIPNMEHEGLVLVKPQYHAKFISILKSLHIKYRIHADNIKRKLDIDDAQIRIWSKQAFKRIGGNTLPYNNYLRLHAINKYMTQLASTKRTVAQFHSAGKSFEGRPIMYMRISTTNFKKISKPLIVIEAGMHGREWLAPPVVTWIAKELTNGEVDLRNNYDWILLPVVNPDGYEYSFTNSRLWRKTRSNHTHAKSVKCPGVDGNRNFDCLWNKYGASRHPCSEDYSGSQAFSEPETRVIRNLLQRHVPRVVFYISLHSYGSMILYPYGNKNTLSPNEENLYFIGNIMAETINKMSLPNFPNYTIGCSSSLLPYETSGTSSDYAHYTGILMAYTFELPGLVTGSEGFHLSPTHIEQVCRETWAGIAAGARKTLPMLSIVKREEG